MRETYMQLAGFAQTWGLVYFVGAFLCVCAYAYWPSKKKSFNEAAQIPLKED
ncbi:CcoQ/FixQ family Cbb3-type cytochrome c oxidase assembly chaperone [Azorhizobium]|uniref:FixQ protein n=2 Tax=Azorhizobium caulinodans TaxID=7 RepID=A8HZ14_AZOC5|nr:CcoQ/FixQ family Cbb3-type cytochrome c oxidase assembly chaperone [Azorhizobium]TDT91235.1 cytochrome c oxidase cbb3-type subunit 4 [Azorhizobium sp. AG788]BAF90523.1 FixQ protein [Azorhizobium caulinodans ORS 571]CAA52431.1 fixQ [Azorhizobium caulinodans ORS 571]